MPIVFSDPSAFLQLVYILAFAAAVFVWYRYRTKKSQIALIAIGTIVAALFFISYWFQSPREEAIIRVNGVIAAMNRYDAGSAMQHVSDRFDYRGAKKRMLRDAELNGILRQYHAVISPWGFTREGVTYSADGNSCTIPFSVSVSGDLGSRPGFFVEATVVKDPDGVYRLSGFKVWENTMQGKNSDEFVVPGLGGSLSR